MTDEKKFTIQEEAHALAEEVTEQVEQLIRDTAESRPCALADPEASPVFRSFILAVLVVDRLKKKFDIVE